MHPIGTRLAFSFEGPAINVSKGDQTLKLLRSSFYACVKINTLGRSVHIGPHLINKWWKCTLTLIWGWGAGVIFFSIF